MTKSKIAEVFGIPIPPGEPVKWLDVVKRQQCPFLGRTCLKNRKSQPSIAIGTCTVTYGKDAKSVIICPHRLLERKQIFTDCVHLLTMHEPGNELHLVAELTIPGGSVDYVLASAKCGKVVDFVGVELQTLDTTGTIWPERQRLLFQCGVSVSAKEMKSDKGFGMNWKMTAKTILVQLHHKIATFEAVAKHLVLVLQDHMLDYMKANFDFSPVAAARLGDPMQFHAYELVRSGGKLRLQLRTRLSTDTAGIATCLGLKATANVKLEALLALIQAKVSEETLLTL
ncbi:MAG: hypothetical protein ACE15C_04995 [Phycisphaerae bacterium]